MDQAAAFYICVFLLSIAFIYDLATKRIPSRLRADEAPKSRFGLVPAGDYSLPARACGVEYAQSVATANGERRLHTAASSLSMALDPIPTQRGERENRHRHRRDSQNRRPRASGM